MDRDKDTQHMNAHSLPSFTQSTKDRDTRLKREILIQKQKQTKPIL